jgi:lantibiotic modifying enzyme
MSRTLAVALFTLSSLALAQTPPPADRLRDTVRGAIAFLAQHAAPVAGVENAVLFASSPGAKSAPDTRVYGGSAGVLVFLENAAAVLDDASARALADKAMAGLLASRRVDTDERATWISGSMGTTGLYTGDAGIGQAFLVRHALRKDDAALRAAIDVGDALLTRAKVDGERIAFDDNPDIIYGSAGTALFLLELGIASTEQRFVDAARRTARGLAADATRVPSAQHPDRTLPIWKMPMRGRELHMPNFSHGTAGVAYAIARIAAHTGDAELLQAAKDGAEWLIENAVADANGLKWRHSDSTKQLFMGGWCHGPVGTGRLFLLLHAITGEGRYREIAEKGANFVVQYAANAEKAGADGQKPYVPPSYCCGVAGVVEFFCDLHRVTKSDAHRAFATKAGDYLLEVAITDGDMKKWRNGQAVPGGPVAADSKGCNLDLMLGAAGEALALLHLATLDQPISPVRGLPDRAVTAPALAK